MEPELPDIPWQVLVEVGGRKVRIHLPNDLGKHYTTITRHDAERLRDDLNRNFPVEGVARSLREEGDHGGSC